MKLLKPKEFPKLVQVGPVQYHICFAKHLNDDLAGYCDFDMKLIVIAKDQKLEDLNATFWHEILHAMEHEGKMKLGHPLINKLEWAILQVALQLP